MDERSGFSSEEREDLISDEDFITKVFFSGKKVLMQKQGHEQNLIPDDSMYEPKEVAKG